MNSHHIGGALFSPVLSRPSTNGIMHPMWSGLVAGLKRAPVSYSGPSASNACPLQSLLSSALTPNPRELPRALFSTVLRQALNRWWHHALSSLSCPQQPPNPREPPPHRDQPPHTPFTLFVRSNNLKPCLLPAGFRDINIYIYINTVYTCCCWVDISDSCRADCPSIYMHALSAF